MAYRPMDDEAVRTFLTTVPARPAILSTTRADGRPHAAPVWYAVDDDIAPFSFVTLEGPVTISDDLASVRHWAGVIGGRYMGPERVEEYGARNGVPGELLVRLTPEKVVSAFDVAD